MGMIRGRTLSWLCVLWFSISVFSKETTVLAYDVTLQLDSEKDIIDHKPTRRELDDVGGSISIDCGIAADFSYTDETTDLHYTSDADFIDTGINQNISTQFNSETLQRSLMNLRSFPQGNRNCYTLRPPEGKDTIYLIRATFMYGNYDNVDRVPTFDLYIGVNMWDSVKFDNASHIVVKEILHVPSIDYIHVCLLNIGSGTPFISALELRHFHNSSYRTESGSLLLYRRLDVGSTTNQIIRYKDDVYDRIWLPYNLPSWESFNTSDEIDSLGETGYKPPSTVMKTAVRPVNVGQSLDFEFDIGNPTLQFYVYMHFAELEILQDNQFREFSIQLNGNNWMESVVPAYLHSTTVYSRQSVRGSKLQFSISRTSISTLPPILNALEIYMVKDVLQAPTDQEDVTAIMDIKSSYGVEKSWQGDPCAPEGYCWDGLDCVYNGYDPPRIISLNLSSRGLKGTISPSLSNLKSLQYLDLSNNSLEGLLPDFLSQLPFLRVLNVTGNKLSGSVPMGLLERQNNGLLSLGVENNPDLCLSAPCKKEKKKFVVPLVAAIISSLVILIVSVILWCLIRKKRGRMAESHEEGSLKSNNRRFTYSEVVTITNNFKTVIGKGGFGTVYHGYLDDGTQVAVKMVSPSSSQGSKEFQNESQLLMRVHHRNLASFVGYCNEGANFGLLYEYMANGNLLEHLSEKSKNVLSWKERIQIAVDAAQGLEYLHDGCKPPIIHRDVKTANILLNENMRAKLADFGFSRFFPVDSGLQTSVVGTFGYLDPEYYAFNRLNEKSDVYSFGIVLLELITGQPAIIKSHENIHIVQWVSPFLARGDIRKIVDPNLHRDFDTNSLWRALETAMACLASASIQRPSMNHVLTELKECLELEIAREKTGKTQGQLMRKSSNSFETNVVDLELAELGPQAR